MNGSEAIQLTLLVLDLECLDYIRTTLIHTTWSILFNYHKVCSSLLRALPCGSHEIQVVCNTLPPCLIV